MPSSSLEMVAMPCCASSWRTGPGPAGSGTRAAYPCVWIRKEGKGRCAYASFGHDKEKLTAGPVPGIVNDLFSFVTGHLDLDLTPNLKDACPGADQFTGV